jgi:hypothetical protein
MRGTTLVAKVPAVARASNASTFLVEGMTCLCNLTFELSSDGLGRTWVLQVRCYLFDATRHCKLDFVCTGSAVLDAGIFEPLHGDVEFLDHSFGLDCYPAVKLH